MKHLATAIDWLVALILRHILHYRVDVVRSNLQAVFTYPDDAALRKDLRAYYLYLGKIFRQTLLSPTAKRLRRHVNLINDPQLAEWLTQGQSAIILMGHTGNWEWASAYIAHSYPDQVCGLYKKIKSKLVNDFILRRRHMNANYLVDISQMGELLRLLKRKPLLIVMIADQNPGSDQGIIWTSFLGRETAFANGPESLSTRYRLPVVYAHVDSLPRGRYSVSFKRIYDGQELVAPGEITARFAKALATNIYENKIAWLWSHRRWKRNKTSI